MRSSASPRSSASACSRRAEREAGRVFKGHSRFGATPPLADQRHPRSPKIAAGRMELELTAFHLPTALDSALTLVRERAGRRGKIQADERKVRQVVLNLLSNAIKFTPEGGRIEVQATPKEVRRGVSQRHWGRHRSRGSGGGVRGVPAGGDSGQEGRGNGARTHLVSEVHRVARRQDLGEEPRGRRLDILADTQSNRPMADWRLHRLNQLPTQPLGVCFPTSTQPADRSARLTYRASRRRSPCRRFGSWPRLSRRRSTPRRSVITLTVGSAANWALKR